jgi:hypothetical protein
MPPVALAMPIVHAAVTKKSDAVMTVELYAYKYPKRAATTIAIRVTTAIAAIPVVLSLALHPSRGLPASYWLGGIFALFAGLSIFLFLVVETWQTRKSIRFRGGPVVNFETSPICYIVCLIFFGLVAAAFCIFGSVQILHGIQHA